MDLVRIRLESIREQDPLKQGLKRCNELKPGCSIRNSRARSIKTRIETYERYMLQISRKHIREQDPLKQGLKHFWVFNCIFSFQKFASKIH